VGIYRVCHFCDQHFDFSPSPRKFWNYSLRSHLPVRFVRSVAFVLGIGSYDLFKFVDVRCYTGTQKKFQILLPAHVTLGSNFLVHRPNFGTFVSGSVRALRPFGRPRCGYRKDGRRGYAIGLWS
jgi:hypothetical protein